METSLLISNPPELDPDPEQICYQIELLQILSRAQLSIKCYQIFTRPQLRPGEFVIK